MEAQHNAAQYYQRDKEQANQLKYQREKESESEKYRKLKMIDDATDPSSYQSSTQKANSLATDQLLSVRNEFAGKTNLPPDQLYLELQKKLTPVAQGYNSYKADLTGQEALAKKAVEVNPNLDMQKILVDLQKQVDSHHLITKQDGSFDFNQATIGTDSNALQEILKPENAWKYSKGTKPLIDLVKKGGEKGELFSQGSDGSQINYTTNIPEWAQLVDEKGNPLEVDPKTGLIPKGKQPRVMLKGTTQDYQETDESGKPLMDRMGNPVISKMVVVPQSTMNKILSNDELEYAFEGDWQKHKQLAKLDVDPTHEQDLKRVYFSQWLNDNGLAQPYVSSRTHLPPQPRNTTINKFGGDEVNINDLYKKIDEKTTEDINNGNTATRLNALPLDAQNVIIDFANKGKNEGGLIDRSNLFISKNGNGEIDIYTVASTDSDGKQTLSFNEKYKIGTLPKVGTNLKVQPGAKEKREVIKQGENPSKVQSRKGKDGKTYTSEDGITWKATDGTTVTLQK